MHTTSHQPQAVIVGTGRYVPGAPVSNTDLSRSLDTSDEWIRKRTGIRQRYIAPSDVQTSDLGVRAAQEALSQAGLSPESIDLIIVATSTPDLAFPSTAMRIRQALGSLAPAFDVSAACSGFVYALSIGSQFIKTGTYHNVLVIGAEKMSTLVDWQDRSTAVLFGDGAGAVVLQSREHAYPSFFSLGSENGAVETLQSPVSGPITMQGQEVFKFAVRTIVERVQDVQAQLHLRMEDIALIVPHQANSRIIESAADKLRIPSDKFFLNIHNYGNTSSASIPISLSEAVRQNQLSPGDLVLFIGFGAGLSWGVSVMQVSCYLGAGVCGT